MLTSPKQSLVVRVNYEKCTVALRNRQLVELANSRIGETTSQVYAELLRLLEENIPRCRLDPAIDDLDDLPDSPAVTTTELSIALSKTIRLSNGIGDPSHAGTLMGKSDKSARGKRPHAGDAEVEDDARPGGDDFDRDVEMNGNGNIPEIDEDVEMNGDGDDPFESDLRPAKRAKVTFQEKLPKPTHKPDSSDDRDARLLHLKGHLQLLAQDSCKFIRKCGKGGTNEWTVDFESLVEHLRESEVDTILLENFGQGGLRLVRMLRKLGKFEEKALPNLALMKQKDIRTKMAEMQMAGMIDIQEVPRDAGRSNNRTIFLWYFDPVRVSSILLDNVYKAMSRCVQRLEVEKRRSSGILAMMERTDVRESTEEEVLDDAQLRMLEEIRAKEEMLLGQIARLDDLVGVFRDY
jgi:DNA-directed RNA polymerase III subunit RPC3